MKKGDEMGDRRRKREKKTGKREKETGKKEKNLVMLWVLITFKFHLYPANMF